QWHRRFQAVVGFFYSCHFCGAQFGTRNFVSSWELRVEKLSRNLLSLRELLFADMFGEGWISSSLCHRRRLLGTIRIVSYGLGQLCSGSSVLESSRRTCGTGSYLPYTRHGFVKHRPSYLWLFLAAARRSRRLVCRSCRGSSADTDLQGSPRRTPHVDCVGSGDGGLHCFFQDSDLRGRVSPAGCLCHCGMAAAQAVAMANPRRLRGCGCGFTPAGESFLCRTERPIRSFRQRL